MLTKFSDSSIYRDILKQPHTEISHILKTLQIPARHSRSINFLGSALKYVAGTPDRDDYDILLTKQKFLIENNNKQNTINSALQNKIIEIANTINQLKNHINVNSVLDKTPSLNTLEAEII